MTRKEMGEIHFKLIELLSNCETDQEFYERLVYAKELIERELKEFEL